MADAPRSGCPINLSLEVFGDRWSLLVLRDVIFGGRRHFLDLMNNQEGISTNILGDRLKRLVALGMLTAAPDPAHRQRMIYSLTEQAIQLIPIMAHLGAWGRRHLPVTPALSIRAQLLEEGGPALWEDFMEDLRFEHLGQPRQDPSRPLVRDRLQAAYEAVAGES